MNMTTESSDMRSKSLARLDAREELINECRTA